MSDIFYAPAAPARRAILDEPSERNGQTLSERCTRLTMKHGFGLSRQAISQHLEVLASAGLVTSKRKGRCKFHRLDTTPLKAFVKRWSQSRIERSQASRIPLANVFVDDQHKARKFYTEVLGFPKKDDVPVGEARWLTVVSEYERLQALGVRFTPEPAEMGPVTTAVLDDTCGNLIQIASRN